MNSGVMRRSKKLRALLQEEQWWCKEVEDRWLAAEPRAPEGGEGAESRLLQTLFVINSVYRSGSDTFY